jgi:hypothetical protein
VNGGVEPARWYLSHWRVYGKHTYTNDGLSWERPLPEIMIELLWGLIESDSNLRGGSTSPWVNGCAVYSGSEKLNESFRNRQALLVICSDTGLNLKKSLGKKESY